MIPNTPDELVEMLDRLTSQGGAWYRAGTNSREEPLRLLMERLEGEDRELLLTYEDAANQDATRWAYHHFQYGYAVGQSGVVDMLEEMGMLDEDEDEDEDGEHPEP